MPAPPDKLRIQTTGGRENASPKEIEQAVNEVDGVIAVSAPFEKIVGEASGEREAASARLSVGQSGTRRTRSS